MEKKKSTRKRPVQKAEQPAAQVPFITEFDQYLFGQGVHYEIYKKMGAHAAEKDGEKGVYFAVWAPNAKSVCLTGDFNGWDPEATPMERLEPLGIYEIFVPGMQEGDLYKYAVTGQEGKTVLKSDPYGFSAELRPGTASKVASIDGFKWADTRWMEALKTFQFKKEPMAIYELHPGSWKKHEPKDEDDPGYYNFRELAPELVAYLKKMGYTHVELIGVAEHPFDGSWGYQVTGYYAPTSRYGTPKDFMYFVNYLHKNKIGVILDWVPAHFPRDEHGLANFDGYPLYEYGDPKKGEHPDWGTKIFDYGRNEIKNFLIANALYWLTEYHVDGLRIDAVASMLYLDYGKQDGQWIANQYGENKNLEAIEFFRHLNSIVHQRRPGAVMIAEESTAWPQVTGSPVDGGLGFDLKWNMGWMNDFLEYQKCDPYFRKYNHNKMTFSMTYAYSENYVLVISHDEVVHLKGSMIEKMPGNEDQKFANLKAAYAFMLGHPGKKLLFMGQEFGQRREWSEARELDWDCLKDPRHQGLSEFVSQLLTLYRKYPALYAMDDTWDGFQWINANDGDRSIFSFVRYSPSKRNNLLFVVNFTPVDRPDYRVGVPKKKRYTKILSTNAPEIGGAGDTTPEIYKSEKSECDGQPFSFEYPLPAYGVAVFKF
ncbi:1,4-alpha-glucan branching protein GlgB [Butyricicoccus porcorum]|uniref:1,4-alpha-glucan branching protein GlgB n=1 Tax=Butyricicoccus porcorum TaxID=1945634 RepID=UPI002A8A8F2B|nr:1,4-alpha-glucan branching protein GlgB [Butyricicoccus porcorum]